MRTLTCEKCGKKCIARSFEPDKKICSNCESIDIQNKKEKSKCTNCGSIIKKDKCICNGEIQDNWVEYVDKKLENYCKKCKDFVPFHIMPHGNRICSICNPELKTHLPEVVLQKNVTDNAGTNGAAPFGISIAHKKCICQNPECGKEFKSKRSDAKTCSTRCRVAAARAKHKPGNEVRNEAVRRALWKAYGTINSHPTYIENGYWEIVKALEDPELYIKNRNEEVKFIDNL